jgi:molybdopterin converting factor small subunit
LATENTKREINVSLKLFTGAFPERISLQLPLDSRVCDLVARAEWKTAEGPSRKKGRVPLKDVAPDDLLVILNGRPINNLQGYDTRLQDGDVLSVFPAMAGG